MPADKHIYWVGPRNSDIDSTKQLFHGSITIFGDGLSFGEGKDKNYAYCLEVKRRRNHNVNDEAENAFFFKTIECLIKKDPLARFLFYNPNAVFFIFSADHRRLDSLNTNGQFLCLNDEEVMHLSNDKRCFAQLLQDAVPLLPRQDNMSSMDGDYPSLLRAFGRTVEDDPRFIFQAPISSGGNGTFIVSKDTDKKVIRELRQDEKFIVSIYEEKNIPINIHAIIFPDRVILTPGSVQIIKEGSNNHGEHRLLYRGADFPAYQRLDKDLIAEFESAVIKACEMYRDRGYRGVCGIDGIICEDKVYLLEMNNRFQASTSLINKAAAQKGLPSIQQVNLAAFFGEWEESFSQLHDMDVKYSSFTFAATDEVTKLHTRHILDVCSSLTAGHAPSKAHIVGLDLDGFNWTDDMEELAYLFRIIFDKSITSKGPEYSLFINENIAEPPKSEWFDHLDIDILGDVLSGKDPKALLDFLLHLKIGLLMQGITFSEEVEQEVKRHGGLRPATNNAVDLRINLESLDPKKFPGRATKYLIINAPTDIDFVEFSPFSLRLENETLMLYYYDIKLLPVQTYEVDPISYPQEGTKRKTNSGIPFDEIGFLSTDRLRVHVTNHCIFKKDGVGCQFCNIQPSEDLLDPVDIEEVVSEYCKEAKRINLTHFLIGGQTAKSADDRILNVIGIIRKYAPFKDIYAMIVPCGNDTLQKLYNAGLNQLSCNIEVFDDEIAKRYMPGKRLITRETYKQCLRTATRYFGRTGNVRTMVIIGLEPHSSLVSGIEEFVKCGIQPILSIFRPLPGTTLEYMQAPPMAYIRQVYYELSAICKKYGLHLGPDCVNCQNNTLALPAWLENAADKE